MKCSIELGDTLTVRDQENPKRFLRLDLSRFYCRLFESTQAQSHDYLEEILKWTDDNIENFESVANNLMHCTAARRRYYGFTS